MTDTTGAVAHLHNVTLLDVHLNFDGLAILVCLSTLPRLAPSWVGLGAVVCNHSAGNWTDTAWHKTALCTDRAAQE
jgi:predicted membrane-bound dolichyl-phosphate-mannose-protein mannosyltransferase